MKTLTLLALLLSIAAKGLDVYVTWTPSPKEEVVTEYVLEWKPTLAYTNWLTINIVNTNNVAEVMLPPNMILSGQTLIAKITPKNFLGLLGPVSDNAFFTVPSGVGSVTSAPMTRLKAVVVAK